MTTMITISISLLERVDLQKYISMLDHMIERYLRLKKNLKQLVKNRIASFVCTYVPYVSVFSDR